MEPSDQNTASWKSRPRLPFPILQLPGVPVPRQHYLLSSVYLPREIIGLINNVWFWTHLRNQKIFRENSMLSDRFYYNILDNVITAGSPPKSQRTVTLLSALGAGPLDKASKG